jgi:chromate transport protein ChrA
MSLPTSIARRLTTLRSLLNQRPARLESTNPYPEAPLLDRLTDVLSRTYDLGLTAFGGPPSHFRILHARFVDVPPSRQWVSEQTYQELFAICQALPGPGSTKMLFCLALLHAGFLPALLVFLVWSLPGALGMYALSVGVRSLGDGMPRVVYALLTGLNASTVGIIALAAVQLAEKAVRDRVSRVLVVGAACAGLCYSALWYFPVIMVIGGVVAVVWDGGLGQRVGRWRAAAARRRRPDVQAGVEEAGVGVASSTISRELPRTSSNNTEPQPAIQEDTAPEHSISVRVGIAIVVLFFGTYNLLTTLIIDPHQD